VPEKFLTVVKIGQTAKIFAEAFEQPFSGTLSRVNPQIDPASRNFEVEIDVPNLDHRLKPGSFVRVSILTAKDPRAVFVNRRAITSFAGLNKAFVVNGNVAKEVGVALGESDGEWIEVVKGLKGDEVLTVGGGSKMVSGAEIVVKEPTAETKPAEKKPAKE